MAERLRRVTGPLETLQQADLERLFLWLAPERREQPLKFRPLTQIARLIAVAQDQLPIFADLFRIGIFVDAIDRRNEPVFQLTSDGFVRGEHELFDQLMRLVVLDSLELDRFALLVEPHLD